MKKRTRMLILLLFAQLALLLLVLTLANVPVPNVQGQSGWLTGWSYRRPVTISNPSGQVLVDYQVSITLGSSFDFTNTLGGGRDVRVATSDGTLIPFWIETWISGTQANLWAKVPSIPPAGTTVYIYYENANPPAPSLVDVPPTGPWTKA